MLSFLNIETIKELCRNYWGKGKNKINEILDEPLKLTLLRAHAKYLDKVWGGNYVTGLLSYQLDYLISEAGSDDDWDSRYEHGISSMRERLDEYADEIRSGQEDLPRYLDYIERLKTARKKSDEMK